MTTWIALLRGVNIGGHKQVGMADLRAMLEALGFSDVQSALQSGNLVFRAPGKGGAALEARLEAEVKRRLRLETRVLVRSAAEWAQILAGNPFAAQAKRDPSHVVVHFLGAPPGPGAVRTLRAGIVGREVVHARGRHAYVYYADGFGRSKVPTLIEKHFGPRATARSWNTVLRLAALAGAA